MTPAPRSPGRPSAADRERQLRRSSRLCLVGACLALLASLLSPDPRDCLALAVFLGALAYLADPDSHRPPDGRDDDPTSHWR